MKKRRNPIFCAKTIRGVPGNPPCDLARGHHGRCEPKLTVTTSVLFDCPYCKVSNCGVGREQGSSTSVVLHPPPPCDRFVAAEPHVFVRDARLAADAAVACVCEAISTAHVAPGWGCCRCRLYNDGERLTCKNCSHQPRPHPYGIMIN